MRKVLFSFLLLLSAALVGAQTQSPYTHSGKVQIRGTGNDALTIPFGGVQSSSTTAGAHLVDVRNLSSSGSAYARLRIGNDASASVGEITAASSASLFGDPSPASGLGISGNTAGGVVVAATNAAGTVRFMSGGVVERGRFNAAGQFTLADGSQSAPAVAWTSETGTGLYKITNGFRFTVAGASIAEVQQASFSVLDRARGTGFSGQYLLIGRNTSGTGAPGALYFVDGGGSNRSLWVDTTGVLRIGGTTIPVEGGSDTIGTVVGTQTSTRASKHILGQVNHLAPAAMDLVRKTPIWAFTYTSGAFHRETFYGITTDDSPLFGMDQGKSFNPVNAFGATVLALQDVDRRVQDLEARLAAALAVIETLQKGAPQR